MTYEEYVKKMDEYGERIRNGEDIMEEVNKFQYDYMEKVLEEYKADTPAKEVCRDILDYAVHDSTSGSAIRYVEDKELAKEVLEIINDELGDYMLDSPESYSDEANGEIAIDCMFAGDFVPEWDGWFDEWE